MTTPASIVLHLCTTMIKEPCACLESSLFPILADSLQLLLPPCVNARQRAALHAAAEACGLKHASQGEGAARRLLLEPATSDDAEPCIDPVTMGDASMDDGALETLLGEIGRASCRERV